eukprot:3602241-Prymnesium_polylepis.1
MRKRGAHEVGGEALDRVRASRYDGGHAGWARAARPPFVGEGQTTLACAGFGRRRPKKEAAARGRASAPWHG